MTTTWMLIIFSYIVAKENQHRKRVHFSSVFGDKPLYCCRSTRVVRSFAALQITDMLVQKVWFISLAFGCRWHDRVRPCPCVQPPNHGSLRQRRSYGKVIVINQAPTKKPGIAGLSLLTIHY
jgi:hypothetical protein